MVGGANALVIDEFEGDGSAEAKSGAAYDRTAVLSSSAIGGAGY